MTAYRLEDLDVYRMADEFSNSIWEQVQSWDSFAKYSIGRQLVEAADSISANIAEGNGRYHYKENKNFCYYSRGSLLETKSWINKAVARRLISNDQHAFYISTLETIHIKLNAYMKHIGQQPHKANTD